MNLPAVQNHSLSELISRFELGWSAPCGASPGAAAARFGFLRTVAAYNPEQTRRPAETGRPGGIRPRLPNRDGRSLAASSQEIRIHASGGLQPEALLADVL